VNFRGEARPERIKAFYSLDLNVQYRFGKNLRLYGGVNNVQDKMPPFDPRQDSYGFAVDQYAPVGRTVYLTARYTFD
jgi:outer membrane receptor protein involved in Fe transport